ncbi:beta,beta-carotene 15,15'-dioxygenase [Lepeophtheirus salmonis]|uniref:beta,beta-carotene 15,15'-dioxygenase n=1 Tax=Lepeophtheirus salmonis TaxID=72036 RepID=UPI001AE6818C|nr:beta,beta-carotene 15,15'-dioxygenase-like [Lepeophtheirus salmonis]
MNKEFNKNLFNNATTCSDVRGHLSGQQLPPWVQGVLLYNGPSGDLHKSKDYSIPSSSKQHWMDGLSMMSSFKIQERGRQISFTKRHLRSETYNAEIQGRSTTNMEYGPQMNESNNYQLSIYKTQISRRRFENSHREGSSMENYRSSNTERINFENEQNDNCNSSFYQFGDLVLATNETSFERIVDPDSLATGDLIDMSHLFNMKSVRPLKDHNGDYYNLAASVVTGNKYHFIKFKRPSPEVNYKGDNFPTETNFVSTIPSRFPHHIGYFHTFGMTDNYLIFCEQPMAYDVNKLKHNKNQGKSYRDCLEWMAGERNHFYIVDKKTGRNIEINYVTDRSYFFFNFVNCYESGKHIIVDMLTYDGPEIMDSMWVEKLKSCSGFYSDNSNSRLMRFVLPLHYMEQGIDLNFGHWNEATAIRKNDIINIRPKIITRETGMENPKINPFFNFRKYNFTYVVGWMHGLNPRNTYANSITKIDMETGMTTIWKTGNEFEHPSEIVFLPNPSGSSEDDGVIISCVSNSGDRQGSYLVFLNARNMREIARANFDEPIPFGSHTHFVQRYF